MSNEVLVPRIMPFRNALGPEKPEPCVFCTQPIEPGKGFPVLYENEIDGWICMECFKHIQDFSARIERHFTN